ASFKIRDRRPFNPDGSLRDVEEETTVEEPTPAVFDAASASQAKPVTESPSRSTGAHLEPEPTPQKSTKRDPEPTTEPLEFINFIYGLASNAFANLGVMPHPVTGEATVDLETAKHFIDIIDLLQRKTKGNLSDQESQMMAELLRDLRMQYVSLVNAPK